MENRHAEKAVDYYGHNFNCSQGVKLNPGGKNQVV